MSILSKKWHLRIVNQFLSNILLVFANASLLPALPPQAMSTLLLLNIESLRRMRLHCTDNNSHQLNLWLTMKISLPMCYHGMCHELWRRLMEAMTMMLTWMTMSSTSCLLLQSSVDGPIASSRCDGDHNTLREIYSQVTAHVWGRV